MLLRQGDVLGDVLGDAVQTRGHSGGCCSGRGMGDPDRGMFGRMFRGMSLGMLIEKCKSNRLDRAVKSSRLATIATLMVHGGV